MVRTDLRTVLSDILELEQNPRSLAVFAGAGISTAPPANLPTVRQFYEMLVRELLHLDSKPGDLRDLLMLLQSRTPFERLLQTIQDVLADCRPGFIPVLLSEIYGSGEPNDNHRCLAELLVTGQVELVLTTNFDGLIERTDPMIRSVTTDAQFADLVTELAAGAIGSPTVAHLHGSLTEPQTIVALMSQVGKPLTGPRREVLDHVLKQSTVVFAGYSGSDWDIRPAIQARADRREWKLVRATRTVLGPSEWRVDLDPVGSEPFAAQEGLRRQLDDLKESDGWKLLGAVALSVGMGLVACERLGRGLGSHWTAAAALAYAKALENERLVTQAAEYLLLTPDTTTELQVQWNGARAFYRRQAGRIRESAQNFEQLREQLETGLADLPSSLPAPDSAYTDLIYVALHEIESLLLITSEACASNRAHILTHCDHLLGKCREWEQAARQLSPTWEITFYQAEVALIKGDATFAADSYQVAKDEARQWIGPEAAALIELREAIARRAFGDWRGSITTWWSGIKAAWTIQSMTKLLHYLFVSPILIGLPTGWYWRLRRIAAYLYPFYGAVKFTWVRVTRPESMREFKRRSTRVN